MAINNEGDVTITYCDHFPENMLNTEILVNMCQFSKSDTDTKKFIEREITHQVLFPKGTQARLLRNLSLEKDKLIR